MPREEGTGRKPAARNRREPQDPSGSGVEPTSSGVEPTSSGVEPTPSGVEQAARLARRWRGSTWLLVAVLVIAGIAIGARQGIQARKGPLVRPAHALGPNQGELFGKPSAPVLVEEYGDFQCPVCASFQAIVGPTVRQLVDQGRIRFVFHEQPILGRESVLAANAATCAGDQGKFWPYHDLLYAEQAPENSGALTADRLIQLGERAGISGTAFSNCVRDGTYEPWLRQVTNQGSVRGVNATPSFFVNGRQVGSIATPQVLREAAASGR